MTEVFRALNPVLLGKQGTVIENTLPSDGLSGFSCGRWWPSHPGLKPFLLAGLTAQRGRWEVVAGRSRREPARGGLGRPHRAK